MELKRLFVAIESSPDLVSIAYRIQGENGHLKDVRWVPSENLHATVCFLGETPIEKIDSILHTVSNLQKLFMPVTLQSPLFCQAPNDKTASMLWLQFEPCDCFSKLVTHAYRSLLNSKPEYKPVLHVTLGRFNSQLHNVKLLNEVFPYIQEPKKLVLFESILTPKGAHYNAIE